MSKELIAVCSPKVEEHNPAPGTFDGLVKDTFDTPQRAKSIIDALTKLQSNSGIEIASPRQFDMSLIYSIHDTEYIEYLRLTSERMAHRPDVLIARVTDQNTGEVIVQKYPAFSFPSISPHGSNPRSANTEAIKGFHAFDAATPISANTYDLALLSAFTALTGADMIKDGKPFVYALCRPPGHHAERSKAGSYCYLNNAAIATDYLRQKTGERVAIIDIDAHHGNGTQEIFYGTSDVFYGSVHGDPNRIPPFYSGHADEQGIGKGLGFNVNIPLPIGSANEVFLDSVDIIVEKVKKVSPGYIVVSLGFDGFENDPLKIFGVTKQGYAEAARRISSLGIPVLSVQEGGYATDELGENVVNFLTALASVRN